MGNCKKCISETFKCTGSDIEKLKRIAARVDRCTSVELLDYTDVQILHFMKEAENRQDLYCVPMIPGNQVQYVETSKGPMAILPNMARINKETVLRSGFSMEEIEKNPTLFYFGNDADKKLVFTTDSVRKTLALRMKLPESTPSFERDLYLARKLGDIAMFRDQKKNKMKLWTILRGEKSYYSAVGMFANDPARKPWLELINDVESFGEGRLVWYDISYDQFSFCYQYKDEVQKFKKLYPELNISPAHVFTLCENGSRTDIVSPAWVDEVGTAIITGSVPVRNPEEKPQVKEGCTRRRPTGFNGDYHKAILWGYEEHAALAPQFIADRHDKFADKEDFARCLNNAIEHSRMQQKSGLKSVNIFKNYVTSYHSDHPEMSVFEFKTIIWEAFADGAFDKLTSEYSRDQLKNEVCPDIITADDLRSLKAS